MSRQTWIAVMILAVGAFVGGALTTSMAQPAAAQVDPPRRVYQVIAGEDAFVLLDPVSAKSWFLTVEPGDAKPAWVPIQRLDTAAQVHNWRARKQAEK